MKMEPDHENKDTDISIKKKDYDYADVKIEPSHKNDIQDMTDSEVNDFPIERIKEDYMDINAIQEENNYEDVTIKEEEMNFGDFKKTSIEDNLSKNNYISDIAGVLPEVSSGSECEDDLNFELVYNSDNDSDYVQLPSSSEDGEDDTEIQESQKRRRREIKRRASNPGPSAADLSSSTSTSAADLSTVRKERRTQPRRSNDSLVLDFDVETMESTSGFRWNSHPQETLARRIAAKNVSAFKPGPARQARSADTPEKCFRLLFDRQIITEIVQGTNQKIAKVAKKYRKLTASHSPTDPAEISALLGMLIFSSCQKDIHLSTREMWSSVTGAPLYRAAMSECRFSFLICSLCFDDTDTLDERRQTDKFAPIRNIWDKFIKNCGEMYLPRENLTINEQLLAFRGRCPFRMYMPDQRPKYGIKIFLANDNQSKYLVNAIPYLGKQETPPQGPLSLGHYYTKELTRPYHNTNRNVITDNRLTSVPLVHDLLKNCGMTLVGTLKVTKKEVPKKMIEKEERLPGSSAFLFTKEMTLVSYVPSMSRAKEMELVLSSMHTQSTLGPTGKPEIIEFYNQTKGGVGTFDRMCALNSFGRKTRRWALCVFYGMINACTINSHIIYGENMKRTGGMSLTRRRYMQELALELIRPWAEQRFRNLNMLRSVQNNIMTVFNFSKPGIDAQTELPVMAESKYCKKRCAFCPSVKGKKTRYKCHDCQEPACLGHIYPFCLDCKL